MNRKNFTLIELLVSSAVSSWHFFTPETTAETQQKSSLFLKREVGFGERGKTSFPVKRSFSPLPKSAFTLIELLVVIAIIAVLAAILLPALNSARNRGQGISCLSNEKQLAQIYLFYADDHDAYLPCMDNLGGQSAVSPKEWLNGMIETYLGVDKASEKPVMVLRCPSEEATVDITTNYGLNYLIAAEGVGKGIKITSFASPSLTAMLVENSGHLCYYCYVLNEAAQHVLGGGFGNNRAAFFRHNGRAGTAFLDGHVNQLELLQIPCQQAYPNASKEALVNTVFNSGKVDPAKESIPGL